MIQSGKIQTSLFLVAMSILPRALADSACIAGFYGSEGSTTCTPAPLGFYVPGPGYTMPLQVPAGSFTSTTGSTGLIAASLGYYVPLPGAATQIQAPAGYYTSSQAATSLIAALPGSYASGGTTGATSATPASVGYYVAGVAASSQTAASLGYYVPSIGQSTQTIAPVGSYVAATGASSITLAAPGYYVPLPGSSYVTVAQTGHYVPNYGSSSQTPTPVGTYTGVTGASSATLAAPGYYVPGAGASAQIPASIGYYVSNAGQSTQTIAPIGTYTAATGSSSVTLAEPGYYVPGAGASTQNPASIGYYVPNAGQSTQIIAPAGTYTSVLGSSSVTLAEPGYYVPVAGSSAQVQASIGHYVPESGQSTQTIAPVGAYVDVANASTYSLATPGHYIPTTGASLANYTDPGYYTSDYGASSQTPAPAGTYVSERGSNAPRPAGIGYYVPGLAASSPFAVTEGFYAPSTGMINELPAGAIAAPLTNAIQAESLLSMQAMDMAEISDHEKLKIRMAYQRANLKQEGLSSGKLHSRISGLTLEADLLHFENRKLGLLGSVAYNSLSNTNDLASSHHTYQAGIFQKSSIQGIDITGLLFYGQSSSKMTRYTVASYADIAPSSNLESMKSDPKVMWYGLQAKLSYPFEYMKRMAKSFFQIGVVAFKANAFSEEATATRDGSSVDPISSLNVASLNYISLPITLGLTYDLFEIQGGALDYEVSPLSITLAVSHNMTSAKKLLATSQYTTTYNFNMPVTQTDSQTVGIVKLDLAKLKLSPYWSLTGSIQSQFGSEFTTYQASLSAMMEW